MSGTDRVVLPPWRDWWPLHVSPAYIEDGGRIPRGFGVAWRDPWTDTYCCLPLGLNVLAHYGRRLYHWTKVRTTPTALDTAFYRGYRHGRWAAEEFGQ